MPFYIVLFVFVVAPSITIHEFFHGWTAYRLGDPTAKQSGRLTLNPLAHIDPVGTILFPIILLIAGLPPIGSAKPVPVNYLNLKNPRRDMLLVSIAGPCANFLLALTVLLFLRYIPIIPAGAISLFIYAIVINIALGIFNLMPIPPLDGSRVVTAILPWRYAELYNKFQTYGMLIVILLFMFLARNGFLSAFTSSILALVLRYIGLHAPVV